MRRESDLHIHTKKGIEGKRGERNREDFWRAIGEEGSRFLPFLIIFYSDSKEIFKGNKRKAKEKTEENYPKNKIEEGKEEIEIGDKKK